MLKFELVIDAKLLSVDLPLEVNDHNMIYALSHKVISSIISAGLMRNTARNHYAFYLFKHNGNLYAYKQNVTTDHQLNNSIHRSLLVLL